jgi:hypothetical protein
MTDRQLRGLRSGRRLIGANQIDPLDDAAVVSDQVRTIVPHPRIRTSARFLLGRWSEPFGHVHADFSLLGPLQQLIAQSARRQGLCPGAQPFGFSRQALFQRKIRIVLGLLGHETLSRLLAAAGVENIRNDDVDVQCQFATFSRF